MQDLVKQSCSYVIGVEAINPSHRFSSMLNMSKNVLHKKTFCDKHDFAKFSSATASKKNICQFLTIGKNWNPIWRENWAKVISFW